MLHASDLLVCFRYIITADMITNYKIANFEFLFSFIIMIVSIAFCELEIQADSKPHQYDRIAMNLFFEPFIKLNLT